MNVGASVQSETISAGTTSNRVLTVDNTDDAAQLNKVISAAREDKLVTKDNIGGQLTDYAKASDLSAKADANDVYSKTDAKNTFATKTELGSYATRTELDAKANTNLSNLTEEGKNAIRTTMADELAKKADATNVYTIDKVDEKLNLKANKEEVSASLNEKADKTALNQATDRITANEGNIAALKTKTTNLSDDGKALNGMTTVETDALKVTGGISNGAGVTTTLAKINDSMTQTATNTGNITDLKTKTDGQQTAINGLDKKTTKVTYEAALGTNVDGVTFNAGKVTGVTSINGIDIGDAQVDMKGKNLTGVGTINGTEIGTKVDGNYIHQDSSIWGNMKKVDTQVKTNADAIAQEKTDREKAIGSLTEDKNYIKKEKNVSDNLVELDKQAKTNADNIKNNKDEIARVNGELVKTNDYFNTELGKTNNHFNTELGKTNAALQEEGKARAEADAKINTKIGNIDDTRTAYVKDANSISQNLTTLDEKLQNTNDRTGGIKRNTEDTQTTIEGSVKVDNQGNVKDVKGLSAETITTTGNATIGGTLGVNGATTLGGTLTAKKDATFEKNVTVEKDLTVNGKLNVDKISMKNDELKNGKKHDSATTITADEISNLAKVTDEKGNTTESQFTHNEKGTFNYAKDEKITGEWKGATSNVTADGVSNKMTDSAGNTHTYYQTATESKEQLVNGDKSKSNFEKKTAEGNTISITEKDADGNLKSSLTNTQTVDGEKTSVTNKEGSSTIKQGADQIRYNVTSKDENKTSSSIEVKADGITNTSKDGTITNTAKNVTNEGTESVTNKVGNNEVKVSQNGVDIKAEDGKKITESVGTASRVVENDKITDKAADSTVTTENGKGTTFGKEGSTGTTNIYGDSIKTGTINAEDTTTDKLTAGAAVGADGGRLTVDAKDGVKGSYESGKYTSKSYILANTLKSGVDNGKDPTEDGFVGSRTDHYMDGDKAKLDETVKDADGSNVTNKTSTGTATTITDGNGKTSATIQDVKNLAGSVTNGTETGVSGIHANDDGSVSIDSAVSGEGGSSVINQKKDSITSAVGNADGSISTVIRQDKDNVTIASSNGAVAIVGKDIVSNAQETITNTAGTSITNQVKDSKVTTDANGTTFENKTAAVSDGGATTTQINGNQITTGRVNANELDVSDTDGNNKADLLVKAGEGVKASASDGNTTGSLDVKADGITTSITNGTDHNTVSSTLAGGTIFSNSGAAAPVTGASGDGTEVKTTIKGNTITTGKVTMDYADVMKDLGVKGNTTLGEAGKDTTLTVNSKATFNNGLTVTNGETKLKNTTIEGTLNVLENATFQKDVTANSFSVNGKTYIDSDGLNANNQVIRNVADGSISEGSKDAVNGGQLYTVKNDLEGKVNKVGANAAAMANLHPMEFDPDSKWNIAAAIGNYGSETAAALGAFYRPNDDVMVNLSTAFGTGENMVGGGVSVRLGKGGNKLSREESNALKDQVNDLTARMDALLSVLNPNMSKDFPDVPENHWAYEAVSRLAGNDIVQGYPDGEFHGERTMTRYEMAEIIYNALSRGAEAERELVEEFKPELQAMAASEKATAERAEG